MNNDIHIRNWMSACPYLQGSNVVKDGKLEYGIYPNPLTTRYRENVLGEMVAADTQEMTFTFTAKRAYKDGNANRYAFYQNIFDWVEEQNRHGNFPVINEGVVTSVVPRASVYVSEPNQTNERSEFQLVVTYRRKTI
jgi:hypothetical protein